MSEMDQRRSENRNRNNSPCERQTHIPCTQWALGRIIALHPGEDGVPRAATVKTTSGEIKRTTKYLCPLPVERQLCD